VFKDSGIVGSDGKINKSPIQACADHLKKSLPLDLPNKAFEFKRMCGLCGGGLFAFFIRFVFVVLGGFFVGCSCCRLLCAPIARVLLLLVGLV
jgi:hypothetical protein